MQGGIVTGPNPRIAPKASACGLRQGTAALIIVASLAQPGAPIIQNVWKSHGPEGGTITALVIDPQTSATLYAGTRVGGAFKSIDGGESWQTINTGLVDVNVRRGSITSPTAPIVTKETAPRFAVAALAIDPLTPTTVYVGTGAGEIFKSTNGGRSWSAVYIGQPIQQIRSLIVDPKTQATLYASGWPVAWKVGQPRPNPMSTWIGGGVLKSIDGGKSWRSANAGLTDLEGPVLAIDPQTPSTLYAATQHGMFKTIDGGDNWRAVNVGLADLHLTAVVIDPQTPATIFVAVLSPTGAYGPEYTPLMAARIFKSIDRGGSWISVTNAAFTLPYVTALAIDPRTPSTLFATVAPLGLEGRLKPGMFKSTDGGRTWHSLNTSLAGWGQALAVDPQRTDTIYAGIAAGGVFKTTDGGVSWRAVNAGLTGLDLYPGALAPDPRTPTIVYASTVGGVFKSTDGGASWRRPNIGLVGALGVLALDPNAPTTIYAGTSGGGVVKSEDGGSTWRPINVGLGDVTTFNVGLVVIDPRTPATIYVSWAGDPYGVPSGVYKSTDAGDSWVAVDTGLPERRMVLGLAIAPSAPTTLYLSLRHADTLRTTIYKTTDGGRMWTPTGESAHVGSALAVHPRVADIIYASGESASEGFGIFKSLDGGRSWRPINTGLTNLHVNAIAIDPQTPTTMYVGTIEYPGQPHGGVFKSVDGGSTWRPMNDGLTDLHIIALAITPKAPSRIYAATRDGVFVLRQ